MFAQVVAVALIAVIGYHLATGMEADPFGRRCAAMLATADCLIGGVVLLAIAAQRWSQNPAELGLALLTLASCCAALAVLPGHPFGLLSVIR